MQRIVSQKDHNNRESGGVRSAPCHIQLRERQRERERERERWRESYRDAGRDGDRFRERLS